MGRMPFFVLVVALLVYIAILLIPEPGSAEGTWDVMRARRPYSECRECFPPQVDALIMRPPALVAALPLGVAAFVVAAPFTALGDASALGELYQQLVGDTVHFVFVDPLGSHK